MTQESRYRSRRFLIVVTSCMLYTALLLGGYIDMTTYRDLQIWTVAAYIAGNGFQKFTDKRYGDDS